MLNGRDVVAACASAVDDPMVADALRSGVERVVERAEVFTAAVVNGTVHLERGPAYQLPSLNHRQVSTVYSKHFVRQDSAGRAMYDAIRLATPWCTACGHQRVKTLDHYLPKSKYPALALVPANLTPMCHSCNTAKSTRVATCPEDSFVHPYFEDFESAIWLTAQIVREPEPHVEFGVAVSPWSAIERARIHNHINRFKLDEMYGIEAARLIAQSRRTLERTRQSGGSDAVREMCLEREAELREYSLNGWSAAMWLAGAGSDWFCDGGFSEFVA